MDMFVVEMMRKSRNFNELRLKKYTIEDNMKTKPYQKHGINIHRYT
tara:strand:+ start:378 stop:515 length:138 start_codon:yes stop_codon:yes gene_type:complete